MSRKSEQHQTEHVQPEKLPEQTPQNTVSQSQNDIQNEPKSMYPSAELIQDTCYQEYRRVLDAYDKINDKVNIALAFCGIILLVIISRFNYTFINHLRNVNIVELCCFVFSLISAFFILWAVVRLLNLLRPREIRMFDSCSVRQNELYRFPVEDASVWLIDNYTRVTKDIRTVSSKKQSSFNKAITDIIVALVGYAFVLFLEKGIR